MAESNLEIMKGIMGRYAVGDFSALAERLSDDIVWVIHGPRSDVFSGKIRGREALDKLIRLFSEIVEIDSYDPREYFVNGDRVVILGSKVVTIKTTGRKREMDFVYTVTLRDGEIVTFDTFQTDVIAD